ncbi:excisionase [Marinobacter sp. M-5]|uniref:excisionase n=1 Tax=Marinobacter sp. M-5 TaxID=3081089 RepID=UPI00293C1C08|nr:excisionase [Marinobacter sp. M-5]MDV3502528.1 excisionase [Marinobacter sp. M-5]
MIQIVTLKKLSELTGYSEGALHKKIHDGVLVEGIHYYRGPDGRIHFDIEEYQKWVKANYQKA